ncbi:MULTISPECIES: nuclear transport factor 2 family protein [unclassified Ruegeria]|uniref:YybH family protein n=1 Tax=unclassified Ruegeria TaxID=2625375 RepID=UPI001489E9A1|nr:MULTISPECIES: nuclear transport factor 2 family protein [unclassified Ruegeria]
MRKLLTLGAFALTATAAFADDPVAELNAVNDAFNAGIAEQDVQGLLGLYRENTMWIEPGKPMTEGLDEARKLFEFVTSKNGDVTHSINHLFVSDDASLAVMIGDVNVKIESAGIDGHGTYLYVLDQVDDEWKIIGDMWNQVAE